MPIVIWLITCLYSFFQFFMQVSGNLLTQSWAQSFHANPSEVSLISSAFFYSYVAMQIPAGMLFDHFGVRRVLSIASIVFFIGISALYLSQSIVAAVIARFIMGAGAGVAFVSMVYVSSIWFKPSMFAMLVGMGEMVAMVGVAILQGITPHFILNSGWRDLMLVLSICALLQSIIIFKFLRDPPKNHTIEQKDRFLITLISNLRKVIGIKNIWYAGFFCCASFGVVSIFAALWGNNFLQVNYQLSFSQAASYLSILLIGVAMGGPIIGALNEKYIPYKKLMLIAVSTIFSSSILIIFAHLSHIILALMLFIMGFAGSAYVVGFYVTQRSTLIQTRGAGIGLCNAIALLGGMIFQPMTGITLQLSAMHMQIKSAYQMAMVILPGVALIAFCLLFLIKLPREAAEF